MTGIMLATSAAVHAQDKVSWTHPGPLLPDSSNFVTASLLGEISIGMKTEPFSDKTARYISVLKADSREELEENYRRFRNTLDIKVETPNGIKGPIWK